MDLVIFLKSLGMTSFQSRIWGRVIVASMEALRHAETKLCVGWPEFRVKLGSMSKSKRRRGKGPSAQEIPLEEGVTAELAPLADDFAVSAKPDHALNQLGVRFTAEKLRRSSKLTGKKSKKADIVATFNAGESIGGGKVPELVFEAKVLDTPGAIKAYLHAQEGIGRFYRANEPYTEERVAAMLAYTVDGDASDWLQIVRQQLTGPPPQAWQLVLLDVPGESQQTLSSRHERSHRQDGDVTVLHFVMRFPQTTRPVPGRAEVSNVNVSSGPPYRRAIQSRARQRST